MTAEFGPDLPDLYLLDGKVVRLDYVAPAGSGGFDDDDDFGEALGEMIAESGGSLYMPSIYSLTDVAAGTRNEFLVFGEGGFSPAEMAAYLAVSREGAEPLAVPASMNEDLDCEHGLSAALCAGPGHYPMEDAW